MAVLDRRFVCYSADGICNSSWSDWGRWVAFAVIVGGAFVIFLLFACLSARRRRRRGLSPYRGTQWLAPPPYQRTEYQPPPPQYTPDPNQGYYGSPPPNQGYFGGQQTGIELQPPSNAYRGGENIYAPPPGPPPVKK